MARAARRTAQRLNSIAPLNSTAAMNDAFFNPALRANHDPHIYKAPASNDGFYNTESYEQGKLFDAVENPRGYGKQRSLSVDEALGDTPVSPKLRDAVKRSQIPVEHLSGISSIQFGGAGRGAGGFYTPDLGAIVVASGHGSVDTVAHEVGHHVDNVLWRTGHRGYYRREVQDDDSVKVVGARFSSLPYNGYTAVGRAEGFADAYSITHRKHDRWAGTAYRPDSTALNHADAQRAYATEQRRWGLARDEVSASYDERLRRFDADRVPLAASVERHDERDKHRADIERWKADDVAKSWQPHVEFAERVAAAERAHEPSKWVSEPVFNDDGTPQMTSDGKRQARRQVFSPPPYQPTLPGMEPQPYPEGRR